MILFNFIQLSNINIWEKLLKSIYVCFCRIQTVFKVHVNKAELSFFCKNRLLQRQFLIYKCSFLLVKFDIFFGGTLFSFFHQSVKLEFQTANSRQIVFVLSISAY